MSNLLDDPSHWRARAEEARNLARQLTDPIARDCMLAAAEAYERMALRAELDSAEPEVAAPDRPSPKN